MRKGLAIVVAAMAIFAHQQAVAQTECVSVGQSGRSLTAVLVMNDCAEPVTVTFFTTKGTEVVNVPAQSRLRLTMLKIRRWQACRGVSVVGC